MLCHSFNISFTRRDLQGYNALHHAAVTGEPTIFQMLFDKGTSYTPSSKKKTTPLHLAVKGSHFKIIEMIFEKVKPTLWNVNES